MLRAVASGVQIISLLVYIYVFEQWLLRLFFYFFIVLEGTTIRNIILNIHILSLKMLKYSGLRNTAVRSVFRRSISSARPEVTELSNGVAVVSRYNSNATTSTTGFVFGSGAAAESPYNNGASSIISNLFTKFNRNLNKDADGKGFQLDSVVERDYQSYLVTSLPQNTGESLKFLNDSFAKNLKINQSELETAKKSLLDHMDRVENEAAFQEERVLEHLHATAFQNTPLSLTKTGTVDSVRDLVADDINDFATKQFKNSNVVIVNDGNVKHEDFVNMIENEKIQLFSGEKPKQAKGSTFLGSEVRLRDDTLPKAWISIAVEGESLKSRDYLTSKVAAEIFGQYNAYEPNSRLQGVKLLDNLQEYQLTESFKHFSLSYKDSGLWGFQTVTPNISNIDDLVHFTLKQWNRLTISVTDTELIRGKQMLKLKLATEYENGNIVKNISSIGNSVLVEAIKPTLAEQYAAIDAITVSDVKAWASKRLWDQDIAIAGSGQIEGLLDYMRIRSDMSMMRW